MALSVGSAVGAGFNLIARRIGAVTGWGAIFVVAIIAIEVVAFAIFGVPPSGVSAAGLTPTADFQHMGAQLGQTGFVLLCEIPLNGILLGAVMRAVLEPDRPGFLSLRLGRQEFALMLLSLVFIVVGIVLVVVSVLAFIPIGLVAGLVGRSAGDFVGGLVAFMLGLAYFLALMWVSLRFALAAPMTFVEGRLRFFGSWAATRGEGWRLFGLAWLLILIAIGLALALLVVFAIIGVIVGIVGAGVIASNPTGFASNPRAWLALGPVAVVVVIVGLAIYSFCVGCAQAIFQAPWADAYRQLRGPPDVAATFS